MTMTDKLIERNPDILGGTPVFAGTRVPVRILMEHLEAGDRLDDFLTDYPHRVPAPGGGAAGTGDDDAGIGQR